MDAILLAGLARQWNETWVGARLEKVWSPSPSRVDLSWRRPGQEVRMAFSLVPQAVRIFAVAHPPPSLPSPTAFALYLRRHLVGARIQRVQAPPASRELLFTLKARTELGEEVTWQLRLEAFGSRPNLVVLDAQGTVLEAFRRLPSPGPAEEGVRAVAWPGLPYVPPPSPARLFPLDAPLSRLMEVVASLPEEPPAADSLARGIQGLSPLFARELVARAGLTPEATGREARQVPAQAWEGAWALFQALWRGEAPEPGVVYAQDGQPLGAFPVRPISLSHLPFVTAPHLEEAVTRWCEEEQVVREREALRVSLLREIRRRQERLALRLARQEEERAQAQADLALRHLGELVYASLHTLPPGAREVRVLDWEDLDPQGQPREKAIPLLPGKDAKETAQAFFARYQKAQRRLRALGGEVERGQEQLRYWEALLDQVARADEKEVLAALAQEVAEAGESHPPAPGKAPKPRQAVARAAYRLPFSPLRYRTPGGRTAWVGRTARENERLSLRVARPDDLWFHVAQGPGAHVVLRVDGPEPPQEEDLVACALLAAYHSPQRRGSHVEVVMCPAGRLRRLPGSPPGMVRYEAERSFSVTPEEEKVRAMQEPKP